MAKGEENEYEQNLNLCEMLLSVAPRPMLSIKNYYSNKRSFYKAKPLLLLGILFITFSFSHYFLQVTRIRLFTQSTSLGKKFH